MNIVIGTTTHIILNIMKWEISYTIKGLIKRTISKGIDEQGEQGTLSIHNVIICIRNKDKGFKITM